MKTKILYIEDEPFLGKIVKETLENQEFEILLINDGALVIDTFQSFTPDICLLDVMLPNIDGYILGQQIRSLYPRLPIIFLTAKVETDDLVKGFENGGTDYIKKPFSVKELIVRINNQLQLMSSIQVANKSSIDDEIVLGKFRFLPKMFELHTPSKIVKLSSRESEVLSIFALHQNECIERRALLKNVWGDDSFFNSRTLDVYIRKLRSYFSEEEGIEIITLKGKGYHFIVPRQ